jgi:hypothetical protein
MAMAYYRLYSIKSGHFAACRDFHARDDAEALLRASVFAGDEAMELWCEGRQVRAFGSAQAA